MTRGWCPSLAAPMAAADGLLVRLRPLFGWIDAAAARLIAGAAEGCGNGLIDLTNRGNLQLRGLSEDTLAACATMIGGLDQPVGRIALATAPLLGRDPAEHPETLALARRIADELPAVSGPAEKLWVGIDGGGFHGPGGADLVVRHDGARWLVEGARLETHEVPAAVAAWCARAVATGWRRAARPVGEPRSPIGFMPYSDQVGGFGIGLAFGAMDGPVLRHLADLAVAFGDGCLRLTGARAIVLTGVAHRDVEDLRAAAGAYVVAADDPLRRIDACVGLGFCASATTDTRADARALASLGVAIHVSGCAKGCAHPAAAPFTLVGNLGGYDVVREGRAGDAPILTRVSVASVADHLRALVSA